MEKKRTIVEAIKVVLSNDRQGLTYQEVYKKIVEQDLYKFGAQDPKSVVRAKLRSHCAGIDFPTASPKKYFCISERIGTINYYTLLNVKPVRSVRVTVNTGLETENKNFQDNSDELNIEERIKELYGNYYMELRKQMLGRILGCSPEFFEKLAIRLLLKMGYGHDEHSGYVTGRSHDGGIDGIIREDKLGLSLIYVQAKRYKEGKNIPVKMVREFIGAMTKTNKGVFVTTSKFTSDAKAFVKNHQTKQVQLIDGDMMVELLIRYELGLDCIGNYKLYQIDNEYFEEKS